MISSEGESRKNTKPCLFCIWAEELEKLREEELRKKEPWKSRFLGKSNYFFAVLEEAPRVVGDTMIISRRHPQQRHYTDIADSSLCNCSDDEKKDFFNFLINIAGKLKKLTYDPEHGKIYLMSMCEYWESDEIEGKYSTEHLHFHLLPRRKEMRTKEFAGEKLFVRPQDKYWIPEMLKAVRDKILGNEPCPTF